MGCHDWSLDGLRVTVVEPQNALLVTSAARVDRRDSSGGREGVLCECDRFLVSRFEAYRAIGATVSLQSFDDTGSQIQLCTGKVTSVRPARIRDRCVCARHPPASARHVRHRARARHTTAKCRRNNSCAAASTVSKLYHLYCSSAVSEGGMSIGCKSVSPASSCLSSASKLTTRSEGET
jgi:hypothetical protein